MDTDWIEFLIKIGSVAGAFTAVSKVVISMYNKTVTEPQNRLAEQLQSENNKQLSLSISPLTTAIDRLNHLLEDSKRDREVLHKKADKNSDRIDSQGKRLEQHDTRISVLEDRCEIRKKG